MLEKLVFECGEWKIIEFEDSSQFEDDVNSLRHTICQGIKNALTLASGEDGQIKINVDNIFPLLKALGLNPQSEQVVDLVREASIESYGDIDTADFEDVVLSMVKEQDEVLWVKRLEEKDRLYHEAEAKKAQIEAERLKLEQERKSAGFEEVKEEQIDEWKEYEQMKEEELQKKEKELKEDELYDNMKMAFRFIDADNDGVISTQDLYILMMGLGEMLTDDELFGMLNMADVDCDGKVTFEDFRKFLLPKSGNESLILSPASLANQLADSIQLPESAQTSNSAGEDSPVNDDTQQSPEDTQKNDDNESTDKLESPQSEVRVSEQEVTESSTEVKEISPGEAVALQRRRTSILYGYISLTKPSSSSNRQSTSSISSIDDDVFVNGQSSPTPVTSGTPIIIEECIPEEEEQEKGKQEEVNNQDSPGQLDSIKEEDEHSNYEIGVNKQSTNDDNIASNKTEQKVLSAVEAKRKLFSRQSSSASLKTKVTDSFGDSGIETMDSVNCSEIRDQPDVFDIYDDDLNMRDNSIESPPASGIHQTTPRSLYDDDDDDEDMVDPLHVHESLSRVSSLETLDEEENIISDHRLPEGNSNEYDRVRNFVNEHMYLEITPDSDDEIQNEINTKLMEKRIETATHLEQAILRRSNTTPLTTVYTSRIERPLSAKPSVNGIPCSHIDIDLRCQSPPKADIKSYKQFTERVRSARSNRKTNESYHTGRNMSIVDISDCGPIVSDENTQHSRERQKWPNRPLTRPRSPISRRTYCIPNEKLSIDLETNDLKRCGTAKHTLVNRRAKSATPLRRSVSPSFSVNGIGQKPERPKTAHLPYTKSRNELNPKRDVLVVQPLANADELYPNKTKLTTFHHGFKSIWPIGRKINLIQTKKPFQSFEMNSYSRAIERNQFPFKGDHNIRLTTPVHDNTQNCQNSAPKIIDKKNVINLDMETDQVKKPTVRKLSLYISPGFTPRTVR
ncbi:hypothetical protein ACF0H5_022655 [Mactra antiquata]